VGLDVPTACIPEHGEEMADAAAEEGEVPDRVAVPQALPREERHATGVEEPAGDEPREPRGRHSHTS
jgi:hypothetical protein